MATLRTKILFRNDLLTNWTTTNPVLSKGEIGIAWDGSTPSFKIGDGAKVWSELPFVDSKVKVEGEGTVIKAVTYDENTRTLTLTKGNILVGEIEGNVVETVTVEDDDVVVLSQDNTEGNIKITATHAEKNAVGKTKGDSATEIKGSGATGNIVIPKIAVDKYGHVAYTEDETIAIEMPTIPAVEIEDAAGNAGEGEVSLISDITAEGHKITATRANAATKTYVDAKIGEVVGDLDTGVVSVTVTGDDIIDVDQNVTSGVIEIGLTHKEQTNLPTEAKGILEAKTAEAGKDVSFKVPNVTVDKYGHVSALDEKEVQVNLSNVYNKTEVDTLVAQQVASAVQYLGTVANLEGLSTTAGKGDFYRASAYLEGTWHAGDLIIAEKDNPAQLVDGTNWSKVHGEEVGVVGIKAGNGIDIDADTTNPTISHANTSDVANVEAANRTYISGIKFDEFGHVTEVTTGSETVVDTNTWRPIQVNDSPLLGSEITTGALNIKAGENVTLETEAGTVTIKAKDTTYDAAEGIKLEGTTFKHTNAVTAGTINEGGATRTLTYGGTFKVPGVTYDAQGHITDTESVTLTLPAAIEYTANRGIKIENRVVGHEKDYTAAATKAVYATTVDAYGHVASVDAITVIDGGGANTSDWGTII